MERTTERKKKHERVVTNRTMGMIDMVFVVFMVFWGMGKCNNKLSWNMRGVLSFTER